MAILQLSLLGGFEARLDSGAQIDIPTKKAQALLAYLALQPGKTLSRDKLANLLWSDRGDKQAHGSLRQALTVLRQALEPVDPAPLVIDRGSVAIEPAAVEVDAVTFDQVVANAKPADLEAADALYQGDLLDGFVIRDPSFEEWLDDERERLRALMARTLTALLDQKVESGSADEAIALAQRLLALDRLQESVHRTLIRLYAEQGQREAALRQYHRCRELLARELDVEPEAQTESLYEAICQERVIPARSVAPVEIEARLPKASKALGGGSATADRSLAKAANNGAEGAARAWRWAVLASAVALVAGVAVLAWQRPWEPSLEQAVEADMALPLPDKPSIAVLPFTNMSGDPEQDHFADGMTDDLITDLSKISGLFVIARNSVFTYKGKPLKVQEVAEELGVRYVLEGSVRRAGDRVRINAQLVDATTGGHLWAERYDGSLEDIFAVQDKFVRRIVQALALNLSPEEQEEIDRGQTTNIEAREAFQRGWEHYLRFSPLQNAAAATELKRAIELDPDYGRAYAALGLVYLRGCAWRWNEPLGMGKNGAFGAATGYLRKAKSHPSSLANVAAAQIYLYDKRHDEALTEAARAIARDPNDPEAHIGMAWTMITTGKPEAGLEFVDTAMRLNPSYPNHYVLAQGMALFAMDETERAAAVFEEAFERDPGATELAPPLAATYARLGRREDARRSLLLWRPGANQRELKDATNSYHFPFPWASDGYEVRARLMNGLQVAALSLQITVPDLVETLREGGIGDRANAAWTLGQFGPTAAAAVPALIDLLDGEEHFMRLQAVITLGKIGPAAEEAIPALKAIQEDERIGSKAKQALEKIIDK